MQYNLDIRDKLVFDSAAQTYHYRATVNQAYYALMSTLKNALCWQNLILVWLRIVLVQLLFIAYMIVKISL
jgi:hypothetical protein